MNQLIMYLVSPAPEHLSSYTDALHRGWSPDTQRPEAAQDDLARIASDPSQFLAEQDDREGRGPPIALPDGSSVPRLPSFTRWLWDGGFCGRISVRWQPGTTELPPTCLGHIGYSVVPWRQNRGYATRALALLLPELSTLALPYVTLTTDTTNVASQRVIERNGGTFVDWLTTPDSHGGRHVMRFRIMLGADDRAVSVVDDDASGDDK